MGVWSRFSDLFGGPLSESDRALVNNYLNDAGRFLFYQMDPSDQRHSIKVARKLLHEVAFRRGIDTERLIQGALLHDLGKVKGDIRWNHRIAIGILRRVAPHLRDRWAEQDGRKGWRYACFVDRIHPERGAYMATSLGLDPSVVELIRNHHEPPDQFRSPELNYLQYADDKV